jgi:hypothetical protein
MPRPSWLLRRADDSLAKKPPGILRPRFRPAPSMRFTKLWKSPADVGALHFPKIRPDACSYRDSLTCFAIILREEMPRPSFYCEGRTIRSRKNGPGILTHRFSAGSVNAFYKANRPPLPPFKSQRQHDDQERKQRDCKTGENRSRTITSLDMV